MNYPPPFQDLATLARHVCLSEHTIERMVRAGDFPQPCKIKCGKRLWSWKAVEQYLTAENNSEVSLGDRIYETARKEFSRG